MLTTRNITLAVVALGIVVIGIFSYIFFINTPAGSSAQGGGGLFGSLFPFSTGSANPQGSEQKNNGVADQSAAPALRQVTSEAVSGGSLTDAGMIRYMERETGHVYETPLAVLTRTRIANTTVPGVNDSTWGKGGLFILRMLADGEVTTLVGVLASSTPEQSLQAKPLAPYTSGVLAPDGKTLWTVTSTDTGSHADIVNVGGNQKAVTLYSSPLRAWVPLTSGKDVYLASAPSSGIPGSLYKVSRDRTLEKIIGNIPGLMALPSPSGKYILYSTSAGSSLSTWVYDTVSKTAKKLPLATLAPKCAWVPNAEPLVFCGVPSDSPTGSQPDSWFLGLSSFTDRAWLLNPETGTASAASDLSYSASQSIDVYRPQISEDGAYALFMNKNDLSLWSLKLK